MIVSVLDYGAGNLHSLLKAVSKGDVQPRVDTDPMRAIEADALILPGVGGFAHAAERLAGSLDLVRTRIESGLPTLGICLGMQLFFETSDEGEGRGLGLAAGRVSRLRTQRVPHIGWNTLDPESDDPLLSAVPLDAAYFAHSFVCRDATRSVDKVMAWTTHENDRFPSMIRMGNAVGVQFHPEKSSQAGVDWIQGWLNEARSLVSEPQR